MEKEKLEEFITKYNSDIEINKMYTMVKGLVLIGSINTAKVIVDIMKNTNHNNTSIASILISKAESLLKENKTTYN